MLDHGNDLIGDVLMDIEAFVFHGLSLYGEAAGLRPHGASQTESIRQGFIRRIYAPRERGGAAQANGAEASHVETMTLSVKKPDGCGRNHGLEKKSA